MCIRDSSKPFPSHPLIPRILILLETCTAASIPLTFIWVPNHKGIPGNEKADEEARSATHQPTILKTLLPSNSDLFSHIKKSINQLWFASWKFGKTTGNKLAELKDTPVHWNSSNLQTRSQEITITRFKSEAHTPHSYPYRLSPNAPLLSPLR